MTRLLSDLSRSNEELQAALQRDEARIAAAYGLIGAILLLGAAGYLLDAWLGSSPWALLTGLVAGLAIGIGNLVATVRRH